VRTAQDKYENDVQYKAFVDHIEGLLNNATFTPSEVREMAMMACINYEMRRLPMRRLIPSDINGAIDTLSLWRRSKDA